MATGNWQLVGEFTEVERGKHSDRPQLAAALAACKKHRAKLVIAKLDRLSRNLAFIAAQMDSGVEFVAVDNPHANKLTVHILAAVAQHEREMIAEHTRGALQAAKARGVTLGNPWLAEARDKTNAASSTSADAFAANVLPIIREIRASGVQSLRGIAMALTAATCSRSLTSPGKNFGHENFPSSRGAPGCVRHDNRAHHHVGKISWKTAGAAGRHQPL
jgi:DNA invertase Pin-like site-specific DNA recombinase